MNKAVLFVLFSLGLFASSFHVRGGTDISAPVAPAKAPEKFDLDSWWNGPSLTYNWFGEGDTLNKHGVYLIAYLTQYGQGLVAGQGNQDFEYGGKLDAFIHLEGQQMGTWKGLSLDAHPDFLYGNNVISHGGMISPVNTALLLPASGQIIGTLSSLFLTQEFGEFSLSIGRFNTVDFTAFSPYDGGAGNTFWNLSFIAPMVEAKTVAPVTNGALAKYEAKNGVGLTLGVFDPQDSSTTTGLPNLFNNGVTLLGDVSVKTNFFGLAGKQSLTPTWSNQQSNALGQLRQLVLPQFFGTPSTKSSTWSVNYHFEQALYQPKGAPGKSLGLFGTAGVSDGNPNPIKWNATFGLGGHSPIPTREDDRLGISAIITLD